MLALLISLQLSTASSGGLSGFLKDPVGTVTRAAGDVVDTTIKAGHDVAVATGKAAGDVAREGAKAMDNVASAVSTAVGDTAATGDTAVRDMRAAAEKAITDTASVLEKAGQDTWAETRRAGTNVEEAGQAIGHYAEASVRGLGQSVSDAEKRAREGKFIDAFWHLSMAPITVQEDAAAQAFLSSSLLRSAGQLAAGVYGSPYGAAAFAAWLTMKQTGNLELAVRVGVLTGASSAAFASAGKLPTETLLDTVKRAAVTGAIGGAAIAAAGGDENQMLQGVVRAGAMVLVQDAYQAYTNHTLDPSAPTEPALCISPDQADCPHPSEGTYTLKEIKDADTGKTRVEYVIDMTKISGAHQFVGQKNLGPLGESSVLMTSVSKIPGMNAMAIFHDKWAMDWDMNYLTIPTIAPAIVITYIGTEAPYQELLKTVAVNAAKPAVTETLTPIEAALSEAVPVNGERPDRPIVVATKAAPVAVPTPVIPVGSVPAGTVGSPNTVGPVTLPVRYETIQQRRDRDSGRLGTVLWILLGGVFVALWYTRRRGIVRRRRVITAPVTKR